MKDYQIVYLEHRRGWVAFSGLCSDFKPRHCANAVPCTLSNALASSLNKISTTGQRFLTDGWIDGIDYAAPKQNADYLVEPAHALAGGLRGLRFHFCLLHHPAQRVKSVT